jgi:hypothetical protein
VTLVDAIAGLDALDEDAVLFARQPWSATSEVTIANLADDLRAPAAVIDAGFAYLLEVHVAREVLEVFEGRPTTLDEKLRLLLHYAEHDAFPDWVYARQPDCRPTRGCS